MPIINSHAFKRKILQQNINYSRMPYRLVKVKGGYYVETISTGRKHSDKPISEAKAKAQLRVLESVKEKKKK